ncbi:hypothetical protein [Nitrospirillum sp. BR 11828]|uniref:hypothetical protein n=1 Tax=Nitrospirillum sp. BR 11828 TaxID=3104325 RepID=UPI002ACA3C4C|nr:hypothetical protein [Nitrospirillum sp. BR 11828]MDZ5649590.1 hypothetical protein [Nitrospirillum sp. BR 11828]
MDTWPITPSNGPEPVSPAADTLSPFDIGGAINLPPSPSERRATAALMRAAYALSTKVGGRHIADQPTTPQETGLSLII